MAPPERRPWSTAHSLGAAASLLLGVAPVLLIGLQWGVAWLTLGRPPRPMLDDPKFISPLVTVLGVIAGFCLALLPVQPFLLPLLWWRIARETPQWKLIALGCVVLPIASVVILRQDPFSIVTWWFD